MECPILSVHNCIWLTFWWRWELAMILQKCHDSCKKLYGKSELWFKGQVQLIWRTTIEGFGSTFFLWRITLENMKKICIINYRLHTDGDIWLLRNLQFHNKFSFAWPQIKNYGTRKICKKYLSSENLNVIFANFKKGW